MKAIPVCIVVILVVHAAWSLSSSNCPASGRIATCTPKCTDSSNCHGSQICCTNICNSKSCVEMNQYLNNKDSGKGSVTTATGTYCGNVKCGSGEKCELDRTTKRQKCVRG